MKTNINKNEPNIKQLAWDYILFNILTQDISLDVDNILLLMVVSYFFLLKKPFFTINFLSQLSFASNTHCVHFIHQQILVVLKVIIHSFPSPSCLVLSLLSGYWVRLCLHPAPAEHSPRHPRSGPAQRRPTLWFPVWADQIFLILNTIFSMILYSDTSVLGKSSSLPLFQILLKLN